MGGKLLGWRTVCAVEIDSYARRVLLARQADGCLDAFPIWDDVTTFDGNPWRGSVDVVSGGFPCQDISAAGKGAGIGGARSGLWSEMARIVREVQPRFVWVKNSPMLVGRGLGLVLLDLAKMGFSARWGVVGACDAGAPHQRDRIWILADATGGRLAMCGRPQRQGRYAVRCDLPAKAVCHAEEPGLEGPESAGNPRAGRCPAEHGPGRRQAGWWESEPDVGRVAYGISARVDRLRCLGNAQVPSVVALAWEILSAGGEAT